MVFQATLEVNLKEKLKLKQELSHKMTSYFCKEGQKSTEGDKIYRKKKKIDLKIVNISIVKNF